MMTLLIKWLVLSAAVWLTAQVLPGFRVKDFGSAFVISAIFAALNVLLGWLMFTVLTIGTLGLAYLLAFLTWWLINAALLKMTDGLTDRLTIDGFGVAMLASASIAAFNAVGFWLIDML